MKCDPNLLDVSSGMSVFQSILQTPKSADFIKLCISHGGNFYKVTRSTLIFSPNLLTVCLRISRKVRAIATRFTSP